MYVLVDSCLEEGMHMVKIEEFCERTHAHLFFFYFDNVKGQSTLV